MYSLNLRGHLLEVSRPLVMGIINATPDSFYSGSRKQDSESVAERTEEILAQGADIIDIGGYSSRPGAENISEEEEYRRLAFALEGIRKVAPESIVSVDTFRAGIARKCVEEWDVSIINDISGGDGDPEMWPAVADLKVPYILMHMRGTPTTMQSMTEYADVVADTLSELSFKIDGLRQLGVCDIIVDPGFGFAKTVEQNYRLLRELRAFKSLGVPVLAALSRKSMIWRPLDISPEESLDGTVTLDTVALMNGADLIRVHDVLPAVRTVRLLELLNKS